jgi:hypothetical protein
MDHALKLRNISLGSVDLGGGLLDLLGTNIKLIVQRVSAVHQGLALLVQDIDARGLGVTLLLPF